MLDVLTNYNAPTPSKATQQNFPQNQQRQTIEVNNSFLNKLNYPCNQAVHFKGNRSEIILHNLLENYC